MEYIQFKRLLEYPELKHAYILRTNEMNFRLGKDFSKIEIVKQNLKTVSQVIGLDYENIVRPEYDHTNVVRVIENLKTKERPSLKGYDLKSTDGLITNKSKIAIMSTNADCNLIVMYEPIKKVMANIHAGWRGTFGKIAKNAIIKMKEKYNCSAKDIICCFCPSIRKCHFEVDEDVAEECKKIFQYTGKVNEIVEKGSMKDGKQKYYIDTVLINKLLLLEEGVIAENIVDSEICSFCHADKIHSRRVDGLNFGLGAALLEKIEE